MRKTILTSLLVLLGSWIVGGLSLTAWGQSLPPGGTRVFIRGFYTNEGTECPTVRYVNTPSGNTADTVLVSLVGGELLGFQPGDIVNIEGTVAELSGCNTPTVEVSALSGSGRISQPVNRNLSLNQASGTVASGM